MKFNEKLKTLRETRGLKYADVGRAIYIAPRAVREWEQGRNLPAVPLLMALSKFYGVSMDELLSEELTELEVPTVDAQSVISDLSFGEKIYMMRKQLMINQAKMCELMGISVTTLEKWEDGTHLPSVLGLMKASKFFGIPMEELLSEEMKEI